MRSDTHSFGETFDSEAIWKQSAALCRVHLAKAKLWISLSNEIYKPYSNLPLQNYSTAQVYRLCPYRVRQILFTDHNIDHNSGPAYRSGLCRCI